MSGTRCLLILCLIFFSGHCHKLPKLTSDQEKFLVKSHVPSLHNGPIFVISILNLWPYKTWWCTATDASSFFFASFPSVYSVKSTFNLFYHPCKIWTARQNAENSLFFWKNGPPDTSTGGRNVNIHFTINALSEKSMDLLFPNGIR